MQNTKSAHTSIMDKRIKKMLGAFIFFVISMVPIIETYDHVPNRSWIYRQTHTKYFVDVAAQLEVDGEQILLTRTIRCIKQPRPWAQSFTGSTPEESSVFDALGGVSKTGRTIVVNVEKACGRFELARLRNELPFLLGPEDQEHPPVLEPIGRRHLPDVIYSYSGAVLKDGRYGIKLLDVSIELSPLKFRMFDTGQYDWIGALGWYGGDATQYRGYYGYELPPSFVDAIDPELKYEIGKCTHPCAISLINKFAEQKMLPGLSLQQLEKIPVEFDKVTLTFNIRQEEAGRITYSDLPIGMNLGHRDNSGEYLLYSLDGDEIKASPSGQQTAPFIFPNNNFILVSGSGRVFYLSSNPLAVNVER